MADPDLQFLDPSSAHPNPAPSGQSQGQIKDPGMTSGHSCVMLASCAGSKVDGIYLVTHDELVQEARKHTTDIPRLSGQSWATPEALPQTAVTVRRL
jgi:hypothetical protein